MKYLRTDEHKKQVFYKNYMGATTCFQPDASGNYLPYHCNTTTGEIGNVFARIKYVMLSLTKPPEDNPVTLAMWESVLKYRRDNNPSAVDSESVPQQTVG